MIDGRVIIKMNKKEIYSLFITLLFLWFIVGIAVVYCYFAYGSVAEESLSQFFKRNSVGIVPLVLMATIILILVSYWKRLEN